MSPKQLEFLESQKEKAKEKRKKAKKEKKAPAARIEVIQNLDENGEQLNLDEPLGQKARLEKVLETERED